VAETDGGEDVLVVELLDSTFDENAGTLTYGANVLKGDQAVSGLAYAQAQQKDGTIAAEFTHASLFIDNCPDTSIWCFTSKGLLVCDAEGLVNNIGTCWSYFSCNICHGTPADYCSNAFPACAGGHCTGLTQEEESRECGGG